MQKKTRVIFFIARTGVIAGLYAALTILLAPISYGTVQLRVSEALTLLPLFFPEAVPGLIIGCFFANIYSGWWVDMVFGTLATVIASLLTYLAGRKIKESHMPFIAAVPPVLINAVILPFMWFFFAGDAAYWLNFISVFIGQALAVFVLGIPLYFALKKAKITEWGMNFVKLRQPTKEGEADTAPPPDENDDIQF